MDVSVDAVEEMTQFFTGELLMSTYEYDIFKRNLADLVDIVSAQPMMRFDLDLKGYFSDS